MISQFKIPMKAYVGLTLVHEYILYWYLISRLILILYCVASIFKTIIGIINNN